MPVGTRIIRAPRGSAWSCRGWLQEAALRMLMHNLDPDAAEKPDDLIACPAARVTMFGQMAGSCIYIGIQEISQGTDETFASAGRRHFGGSLATRDVDESTSSLDEALDTRESWKRAGTARSIALEGDAADLLPAILQRGIVPDVLTDQTSARDALNGDVPRGMSIAEAAVLRERRPEMYIERARGAVTFDDGNNIRSQAKRAGIENAFDIPGFVPEYVRPSSVRARVHSVGSRSPEILTTCA